MPTNRKIYIYGSYSSGRIEKKEEEKNDIKYFLREKKKVILIILSASGWFKLIVIYNHFKGCL
jgi:hypothetical protein